MSFVGSAGGATARATGSSLVGRMQEFCLGSRLCFALCLSQTSTRLKFHQCKAKLLGHANAGNMRRSLSRLYISQHRHSTSATRGRLHRSCMAQIHETLNCRRRGIRPRSYPSQDFPIESTTDSRSMIVCLHLAASAVAARNA